MQHPVSAKYKDMAYTLLLAPTLQTTQHALNEEYKPEERANNRCGHPIVSFAVWKLETPILPGNVSDVSRLLLRYMQLFVQILVLQNINTIADFRAVVHEGSPPP
mgnify:CR=1 FL=1